MQSYPCIKLWIEIIKILRKKFDKIKKEKN